MTVTAAAPGSGAPRPASASKALLIYNGLRLGLLAGCIGLGYLAGLRGFALIIVALLISGVLSWFALRSQRIRAAIAVEQVVSRSPASQRVAAPIKRRRAAIRARVAAEDAYVDSLQREAEPSKQDHDAAR